MQTVISNQLNVLTNAQSFTGPSTNSVESNLIIPDQEEIKIVNGRAESNDYSIGTIVQLERIGYAIITEDGYLLMHE